MVQDTQVLNKQSRNEIEGGERERGNSIEEHLVIKECTLGDIRMHS